ncbi:hypothetical protein QO034_06535 [Sedimentitalea sp. JM2-8]|uniref:Uncharacterized protein n=1 Tax=Sedimentitalea xiamensis TaxID=3050037 RepID=A0ABT7FCB9_9RHOB|nr:hypothetical protein [Sedimentitalea xiamensis]MDK3072761.1 hypothetical protein [Sedimentitalea xiamensis]
MTGLNSESGITLTTTQFIGGITALIGGLAIAAWAVLSLVFGGVSDNISDIRTQVSEVRNITRDLDEKGDGIATALRGELSDLSGEVSGLRSELSVLINELRVTNSALSGLDRTVTVLQSTVSGLDTSIVRLDDRLTSSVSRQQDFERYVVARLGPVDTSQPYLLGTPMPYEWGENQEQIIELLYKEVDPLETWYKSLDSKKQ